ncbi:MAG TPA: hypothetical protein VFH27_07755 [Longimicrobiaceae bacterium]|nr:hypothetical protein [Longimicrobiaceae bacterium]
MDTSSTTPLTAAQMAEIDGGTDPVTTTRTGTAIVDPITGETVILGCTDREPRPY